MSLSWLTDLSMSLLLSVTLCHFPTIQLHLTLYLQINHVVFGSRHYLQFPSYCFGVHWNGNFRLSVSLTLCTTERLIRCSHVGPTSCQTAVKPFRHRLIKIHFTTYENAYLWIKSYQICAYIPSCETVFHLLPNIDLAWLRRFTRYNRLGHAQVAHQN